MRDAIFWVRDDAGHGQSAFNTAYGEAVAASDKWIGERHRVEALPDCLPSLAPGQERAAHERYDKFMCEHGVWALFDRSTDLWRNTGALANAVSASPDVATMR